MLSRPTKAMTRITITINSTGMAMLGSGAIKGSPVMIPVLPCPSPHSPPSLVPSLSAKPMPYCPARGPWRNWHVTVAGGGDLSENNPINKRVTISATRSSPSFRDKKAQAGDLREGGELHEAIHKWFSLFEDDPDWISDRAVPSFMTLGGYAMRRLIPAA